MRRLLLHLLLLLPPGITSADDMIGRASAIDGDTLEIHGLRVRLHGIDAPESSQQCQRGQKPWACGRAAAFALADRIEGRTIRCEPRGKDRYKRIIAVCYEGDEDLNAWMVRTGWAVAYRRYSKEYVELEMAAQREGRNLWATEFQMPEHYRRNRRRGAPG